MHARRSRTARLGLRKQNCTIPAVSGTANLSAGSQLNRPTHSTTPRFDSKALALKECQNRALAWLFSPVFGPTHLRIKAQAHMHLNTHLSTALERACTESNTSRMPSESLTVAAQSAPCRPLCTASLFAVGQKKSRLLRKEV